MGACTFARASGSNADQAEFSMPAPSGDGEMYRGVKGTLTFSTSYATGGDTIPKASVGLDTINAMLVDPIGPTDAAGGFSVKLGGTPSAPTLMAFLAAGGVGAGAGTQVAAAANCSTHSVNVILLGH
jgi:hypothetical protein